MSKRWSPGNPFLITPVSNVFDLPDQCLYRAWISIHLALALRTRIECFALVVLSRLANHDLSLAVQRLEFRFKLRQEFPDFGINGRGVA